MFKALSRLKILAGQGGSQEFNRIRPVFATMAVTQDEANTIAVTGTGSDQLPPPAAPVTAGPGPFNGFYKVAGFSLERAKEITFASNELTLPSDGTYTVNIGWAAFRHSTNQSTVGFVLGIERAGQIIFSQRPTSSKVPNGGDLENIAGGGTLDALAGDKLSVWLASDNTGTVTVPNANLTVQMIEDTSI